MLSIMLAAAAAAAGSAGAAQPADDLDTAYFAAGCFWCSESDFEKVDGVTEVISGFMGGHTENPTYEEVSHGGTGHYESVKVVYDPEQVSYDRLLYHYWRNVDPYDANGQFCDRGDSYRGAIFVTNDEERAEAQASKKKEERALGDKDFVTQIISAGPFTAADDYHQDYYKSDDRILSRFGYATKKYAYEGYREGCGRDARLKEIWGDEALGLNAGKEHSAPAG